VNLSVGWPLEIGGEGWIRTSARLRGRIYSLLDIAKIRQERRTSIIYVSFGTLS